jgi:esterase/lipase
MVTKKISSIRLKAKSDLEFFMIHGYSGSPTDFGKLPNLLHKKFKANVYCPLLPGHGTRIEDLYGLELNDFINFVETELTKEINSGKRIILIGISLGAQLAMYLASKFRTDGLILCSTTHHLRPITKLSILKLVHYIKRSFPKNYHPNEIELRKHAFYYDRMPTKSLCLSLNLRKITEPNLGDIDCPVLFVHGKTEKLGDANKLPLISNKISSKVKEINLIDVPNHNLFYSERREKVYDNIIKFIRKNMPDNAILKKLEKASAIVPSYNEAKRIGKVLEVLERADFLNEIIVIDDGSTDNTEKVVKNYKKIKYIRNKINLGKGQSMDKGVRIARNDVIFFCDADLIKFKPDYVEEIILPVLENKADMFIGMRGNFMQRTVTAWGLNSGERALRKKIWKELPKFYKYRYRIEAGLNYYVSHYCRGLKWKRFDYSQPIKEKKYGFFKGTLLRWWMNLDVLVSYFSFPFVYKFSKK